MQKLTKICKVCKGKFKPFNTMQKVCGVSCSLVFAREKHAKNMKKIHTTRKREFYDNDMKTRKAAAKKACHDYIKLRDKGLPCICCNRTMSKQIHAGHFLESNNNPINRYHEDNIHSQAAYCNTYKGGNSDDYEGNLRLKIGDKRVDYLLDHKGGTIKRTCDDYRKIEKYYKEKVKLI